MRVFRKKSAVALIIALFITFAPLAAHHKSTSLSLLIYNDAVTLGLAENRDDLRSYGMNLAFEKKGGLELSASLSGLTLRLPEESGGRRYDEIVVEGGKTFILPMIEKETTIAAHITLKGGVALVGDLGFAAAQNVVHEVLSIDKVYFPYESEQVHLYPYYLISQGLEFTKKANWYSSSTVLLRPVIEQMFAYGYEHRIYGGFVVGQRTEELNELLISIGYTFNEQFDGWETHKALSEFEQGLTASVQGHLGLLAFSYQWYLQTRQGYGGFGVNVGLSNRQKWVANDLLLSLGMSFPANGIYSTLRYALNKSGGIIVGNFYKMFTLADEGRLRENVSLWFAGYDYEFSSWDFGLARPFGSLAIGLRRFLVTKDTTEGHRAKQLDTTRFSAIASVGLRFFPSGELQYDGVAYGIEVSTGVMLLHPSNPLFDPPLELADAVTFFAAVRLSLGSRL